MKKLLLIPFLFIALQTWAQHTVVLRPHFNGEESNLFIIDSLCNPSQNYANTPNANYQEFLCDTWTYQGCFGDVRHLLRFAGLSDTSVIPADATITSATLYLYGVSYSPEQNYGNSYFPSTPYADSNTVSVFELSDSVDMQTVTWNTQPGINNLYYTEIPSSHSQWNENDTVDVTTIVNHMMQHGNTGFMFKIKDESPYRERLWATDMFPDTSLHPMLIVNYEIGSSVKNVSNEENKINIYPNPVQTQLNMSIDMKNYQQMQVYIYDIAGRIIHSEEHTFVSGNNSLTIPTNDYMPGVYKVVISNGSERYNSTFVKR